MTSESESDTVPWVKEKGAKYGYAYDPGTKFLRSMGLTGWPTAWLIDASGRVVYQGSPSAINEQMLEPYLKGAMAVPMWEWPKEAAPIKKPLVKRQMAAALKEAEKLAATSQELAAIRDGILGVIDGRIAGLKKLKEDGNALDAVNNAASIAKECAGLPAADEATSISKAIVADPALKAVMDGQAAVRKLREKEVKGEKDVKAAVKKLKKIAEEHPNTAAAHEADAFKDELEASLQKRG